MTDLNSIDYLANYVGSMTRSAAAKVDDVVSVKDFGAKGDGSSNDTAAFTAAIATGRAVYIPGGVYIISSTLSVSRRPLSIHGDGPETSVLIFQDCDGINITHYPDGHPLKCSTIRDLSFKTTVDGTRQGLILTGSTSYQAMGKQFMVENCCFVGVQENTCWFRGINLSNGAYSEFNGNFFLGNTSEETAHYEKMDTALYMTNISTDTRFTNNFIYYARYGILLNGDPAGVGAFTNAGEGLFCSGSHMILVSIGVKSYRNKGNYIVVENNHIAATECGVWIGTFDPAHLDYVGSNNSQVNHNLIFKRTASSKDFIGIHVEANQCSVIGNEIRSEDKDGSLGKEFMIVSSGNYNRIIGNHVDVADSVGIWVQSRASYNAVIGNTGGSISSRFPGAENLINQGNNTRTSSNVFDNWDVTRTTLLHKSGDTGIGNGWNVVSWDTVVRDPEGHWDNGGRLRIFTAGRVKLEAMVIFSSNGTNSMHTVKIIKNGANYFGVGAQSIYGSGPAVYVESAEIDVQAGDYFEVAATQSTGGSVYASSYSWFQLKVIN